MAEEIQIQTVDEVKNIDYMKNTNEVINNQINEQIDGLSALSDTLDSVNTTLNLISDNTINTDTSTDLSEVVESIDNIDTTIIEAQTQDILSIINNQQEQINNIESSVSEINEKINEILDGMKRDVIDGE